MIDKILILACDRDSYLKKTIDSISEINVEKFCILDIPVLEDRKIGWENCRKILKKRKITLIENEENMGCAPSMFKLLDNRNNGINLILEDDCPLIDGAITEIENILKGVDHTKPFIIKLNQYCWGWIANGLALDLFKKFRLGEFHNEEFKDDINYRAIQIFQQKKVRFTWDELIEKAIIFCNINTYRSSVNLTLNIGKDSSRISNQNGEVNHTAFALFRNGKLIETGYLS